MSKKMLYILNVANRVNNFSFSSMIAAQSLGFEYHIAGNWGYKSDDERRADEEKYGIHIHQIDFIRTPYHPGNIKAYKQLAKIAEKENFDVIHCNTPIGGIVGRLLGKQFKTSTVIYQSHGFHFYTKAPLKNWLFYYPAERILAHLTDYLLTINEEDYCNALHFHLKKGGRVFKTLGVGFDYNRFANCKISKSEYRKSIGIPEDAIVLISVGEIADHKNQGIILEALKQINNKNLYLILCGVGPCSEEYRKRCIKYGLENNVLLLGRREDIPELCHCADIFVFPSKREGMGIAPLEGMASGLPLISSNVHGIKDYSKTGVTGYALEYNDVIGFANAIKELSYDEELRRKFGNFNKEFVKKYDRENCINIYKNIYQESLLNYKTKK